MKNTLKTVLAAAAIASALGALQAQAQFTYNNMDLLLNFRQSISGVAGTKDVTIDIGNVNTFLGAHTAANGGVLIGNFQSLWTAAGYANMNNVYWTAAASDYRANIDNLWIGRARSGAGDQTVAGSTAWTRRSAALQGGMAANINGTGGNGASFGTGLGSSAVSTVDANPISYHYFVGASSNWKGSAFSSVENNTGSSFAADSLLDFYTVASGSGASTYEGYFSLAQNGNLYWFDATPAVPEPATYGALAGVGMLALAIRRKVKAQA